ncbi:VKOR family protein [Nanoarchaeota archaeon]
MSRLNKYWFILFVIFSVIGVVVSSILLYTYYFLHISPLFCPENYNILGVDINCLKVLSSSYSKLFNLPLDFLALIWFIIDISLVTIYNYLKYNIFRILFYWRLLGLLFIPYLIYTEIMVINSICIYCTTMQSMIILDFIISIIYSYKNKIKLI